MVELNKLMAEKAALTLNGLLEANGYGWKDYKSKLFKEVPADEAVS